MRHWMRNTLSDELQDKIGNGLKDIFIVNKEETTEYIAEINDFDVDYVKGIVIK